MNYDDLNRKLKQLKVEEFIWIIYVGIIILSFYSNNLERKYFISNDIDSREKYRKTMIIIFSILIVVYLYFLKDSYDDLKTINSYDSENKKNLLYLSFLGSLFIFVSGLIFLYIVIKDGAIPRYFSRWHHFIYFTSITK